MFGKLKNVDGTLRRIHVKYEWCSRYQISECK